MYVLKALFFNTFNFEVYDNCIKDPSKVLTFIISTSSKSPVNKPPVPERRYLNWEWGSQDKYQHDFEKLHILQKQTEGRIKEKSV